MVTRGRSLPERFRACLTSPTQAEQAFISRLRSGETQAETAQRLGVTERAYREMEKGRVPFPVPVAGIQFTDPEWFLVLRRRYGIRVQTMASNLGISHVTYHATESGHRDPGDLYSYWVRKLPRRRSGRTL